MTAINDTIQDYISSITDLDRRIGEVEKEAQKIRGNTSARDKINQRLHNLWIMRGDMAFALRRLKEYDINEGQDI